MLRAKLPKKQSFKAKKDPSNLYGLTPVWWLSLKLIATGMLMSFVMGMFTFADQLMLVNFMPITQHFCFNNLFYHTGVFEGLVQELINPLFNSTAASSNLYHQLVNSASTNNNQIQQFVTAVGNVNQLGIYDSDSVVRSSVSLIVALSDIVYIIPSLYAIGVSIKYSQALGKGDYRMAMWIWQNAFYGTTMITLLGCLVTFILIPTVTPAQSVLRAIPHNEFRYINQTNKVLNSFNAADTGLNNFYYFVGLNCYERLHYLQVNNTYQYYLQVANNSYINITNFSLANLTCSSVALHVQIIDNATLKNDTFSFFLVNSNNLANPAGLINIWNHYFVEVRNDSIQWAEDFLYIITSGLLILSINNLLMTILRCDGAIAMVTVMAIAPVAFVIVLDYIFIYYAQIGMDGAAVASLIGWTIQLIWAVYYIKKSKKLVTQASFKFLAKRYVYLSFNLLWQLCLYGGTIFLGNVGWMITDILLTNQVTFVSGQLLPNLGNNYYLSIMGALMPITNLFMVTIMGSLQYISPIFSYNYASKQNQRFQGSFWYCSLYVLILTVICYFVICFIPEVNVGILSWFRINANSPDEELISSVKLLKIWFLVIPSYSLSIGGQVIYLCCDRPGLTTIMALMRSTFVFIPVLYIFSAVALACQSHFNAGLTVSQINNPYVNNAMWFFLWAQPTSYWTSGLIIFVIASIFIYTYFVRGKRRLVDCAPYVWFRKAYIKFWLDKASKKVDLETVTKEISHGERV